MLKKVNVFESKNIPTCLLRQLPLCTLLKIFSELFSKEGVSVVQEVWFFYFFDYAFISGRKTRPRNFQLSITCHFPLVQMPVMGSIAWIAYFILNMFYKQQMTKNKVKNSDFPFYLCFEIKSNVFFQIERFLKRSILNKMKKIIRKYG